MASIDWPKLLEEIALCLGEPDPQRAGQRVACSTLQLSEQLGVPRGTLRGWLDGSEPKHGEGERLVQRWAALTGKAALFAPRQTRPLSAART